MSNFPFVSVIVPTYNRLPSLRQTVESLLQQTYPAGCYEIIVVDDGSTDGTSAYLAEVSDGVRLRAIRQANSGPAAARNSGVGAARNEWLAFTDDDCRVNPDWLAALARCVTPRQAVGGPVLPARSDHRLHRFYLAAKRTHPQQMAGAVNVLFSCNMAVHRRDLLRAGGFDPAFVYPGGEDLDLSYRLQEQGVHLTCVPDAALHHEYPTHWRAFSHHFWGHGQGMALVFGKWPHQAPPGLARRGRKRIEQRLAASPAFPLLLAFWQLLMCLGYSLLTFPKVWHRFLQSSANGAAETIVNMLLSCYVLLVEQAGLVVGTYRWGKMRQSKVRKG